LGAKLQTGREGRVVLAQKQGRKRAWAEQGVGQSVRHSKKIGPV